MGLDFVELIISIEDVFDIAIEDEQVWEAMKNIIVSELGVKTEEVVSPRQNL